MKTELKWGQYVAYSIVVLTLPLIIVACAQQTEAPEATLTQPVETGVGDEPASLASPVITPASPVPLPTPGPQPTLPPALTGPLTEFTINRGIRADFVNLPFYRLLTWTGITWDGNGYVWIANNELQAIAGFNIEKSISDRLVSFPIDLEERPQITGLTWDGASFWVSDIGNGGIIKIDPVTGNALDKIAYDGTPNGLVWAGDGFWVISKDRLAIEKVTLSGERAYSLPIPGIWPTGLAWDGKYFWYSDAHEGSISILNPASGKSKKLEEIQFMANQGAFNGLAWMSGYLWIATEGDERLHRLEVSQLDWQALEAAID